MRWTRPSTKARYSGSISARGAPRDGREGDSRGGMAPPLSFDLHASRVYERALQMHVHPLLELTPDPEPAWGTTPVSRDGACGGDPHVGGSCRPRPRVRRRYVRPPPGARPPHRRGPCWNPGPTTPTIQERRAKPPRPRTTT